MRQYVGAVLWFVFATGVSNLQQVICVQSVFPHIERRRPGVVHSHLPSHFIGKHPEDQSRLKRKVQTIFVLQVRNCLLDKTRANYIVYPRGLFAKASLKSYLFFQRQLLRVTFFSQSTPKNYLSSPKDFLSRICCLQKARCQNLPGSCSQKPYMQTIQAGQVVKKSNTQVASWELLESQVRDTSCQTPVIGELVESYWKQLRVNLSGATASQPAG